MKLMRASYILIPIVIYKFVYCDLKPQYLEHKEILVAFVFSLIAMLVAIVEYGISSNSKDSLKLYEKELTPEELQQSKKVGYCEHTGKALYEVKKGSAK